LKPPPKHGFLFAFATLSEPHIATPGKMHMAVTTFDKPSGGPADKTRTKPAIFIDGEAGTTGIEIRDRLAEVAGVEVLSIAPEKRKDPSARKALMSEADLVILCLPDQAAKEAVALADELGARAPRILDASSAHRVAEGWTYGWPEMGATQPDAIARSRRVSNPGCYPTGGIALIRPLIEANLMPADYPVTVNAVSGYSGGGRSMIEAYESGRSPPFELYGLDLEHKHVPELQKYSKLTRRPIFVPSIGNFRKGMMVSVPLHLDTLPGRPKAQDLEAALATHFADAKWVKVIAADDRSSKLGRLDALALNDTNLLELRVFGNERYGHAVLVARLDNLGKGASGAAVQNIGIMLGVET
jgi:N-acetyl-gamma-glutamyl-phosphate reductase